MPKQGKEITEAISRHFIHEKKPKPPTSSWWATPANTRAEFVEAAKARDAEMGWSAGSRGRELQTCYDDWRFTR